jgi:hypothetical protein
VKVGRAGSSKNNGTSEVMLPNRTILRPQPGYVPEKIVPGRYGPLDPFKNFRDLLSGKRLISFVLSIYSLMATFVKQETYGVSSKPRCAADLAYCDPSQLA